MASVAGRPFLEVLLRQLYRNGFRHAILAVGYQQQAIRSSFGEQFEGLNVVYSGESEPLGTGGAVRKAADLLESDAALIMNGDSYTDADLVGFVNDYRGRTSDVSMLVVPADGREDCGTVLAELQWKVVTVPGKEVAGRLSLFQCRHLYAVAPDDLANTPRVFRSRWRGGLFPRWLREGASIQSVHSPGKLPRYRHSGPVQQSAESLARCRTGSESGRTGGSGMRIMITGGSRVYWRRTIGVLFQCRVLRTWAGRQRSSIRNVFGSIRAV